MADRLWDALLATAQELGVTREGVATGGSTTTLIDTVARQEPDNYWDAGTIFYEDADGAESYNNYCARISSYDYDTNAFTFSTQTQAPEAGDRYIIANARYPKDMLIAAVNATLRRAMILDIDETVSTEDSKTEYTLPTTIYRGNLRYVYYQTQTDDSNDNRWKRINDWRVEDGDTGVADTLILYQQYTASRTLQLHYLKHHPAVSSISTQINENILLPGLALRAAIWCMRQRMAEQNKDAWAAELMNEMLERRRYEPLVRKTYPMATVRAPYIEHRSNV